MKIDKLIIYGFGKHENLTINIDRQLSVFYGTNEAGKTTIQQFIIQTLFGYPARNQALLRYEPKSGGKYGGQVHIQDPVYGKAVIERVKGKSAGDVTVFFEDGSRGTEADLQLILRDYDRTSFESVFSFSIHELQGLERMTEDELSRTLLASGTTGVDAITKMESRLEKDMAVLFKKTGRNPQMNILIEELRTAENELKEFRQQAQLYGPYIQRISDIKKQLEAMAEEEKCISNKIKNIEKWRQAAPLMEKTKQLETAIAQITVSQFPSDGRRRMDRLMDRVSETSAKISHLEKEMSLFPDENEALPDTGQLERLLSKESEWHQLRSMLKQKQDELLKLSDEMERLLHLVGMSKQDVLQSEVSLNQEERLIAFVQQADIEEEDIRFRKRALEEEQTKFQEIEKELDFLSSHAPSEKERKEASKWSGLAGKLAEAKAAEKYHKKNNSKTINIIMMVLGIAGAAAGFLQRDYVLAVIGIIALSAGAWLYFKNGKTDSAEPEHEKILSVYKGKEAEFDERLRRIGEYDRKFEELERAREELKRKITGFSRQESVRPAKRAYEEFLQQLGIGSQASRATVLELFEKLREIHAIHLRIERANDQAAKLQGEIEEWTGKAAGICGQPVSSSDLYAILRAEFNLRKQVLDEQRKRQEKKEETAEEVKRNSVYAEQLQQEVQSLLNEASAKSTEDFYRLCEDWSKKEGLLRELHPICSQLDAMGEISITEELTGESAADYIQASEAKLQELTKLRNELLAELAEKQQTTKTLLTDTAYEEKLQHFEEKKTELADLAQRWSVDKAITEAIKQTMEELKEKQLPSVIASAQSYFEKLTSGSYIGLEMNAEAYFEAVRKDGIRFHIAELSQATKEQAYIALRLSLALSMQKSHPFPIIMDDPFVHFDRRRLQQMVNLIAELEQEHQFIYFTCHEEMRHAWPDAQIVDVANTERSVYL